MGTTSILQFADVHFGAEDEAAVDAAQMIARELDPDLVLICGDLTQTGSVEEYEAAGAWVAEFAPPVVATPGNHDAPYFAPIERVVSPYKRFEEHIAAHCQGSYADDRVAVMTYNSSRAVQLKLDWSVGAVDLEELAEAAERFRGRHPAPEDTKRLHLLACHHPMIYPPESPLDKTTDNGPEALEWLSDSGWDAVLSGHIHIPFVKEREPGGTGLLSIGAGTLSTRRRGVEPSFNHIEVDADGMRVTAVDFAPNRTGSGGFARRATWNKPMDAFA